MELQTLNVIALSVSTAVLAWAGYWAGRMVAAVNGLRRELREQRRDFAEALVTLQDHSTASEERVVAAVRASQRALEAAAVGAERGRADLHRAQQRLDWTTDHLLDREYPDDVPRER